MTFFVGLVGLAGEENFLLRIWNEEDYKFA
jgi:hypothetical protein